MIDPERFRELEQERDRLRARVRWLRRAYGKLHRRRISLGWLLRDINAARLSANAKRDEMTEEATKAGIACMEIEGRYHELEAERDRLKAFVEIACEDLDKLAERTGNGDIGLVVERLVDELGLSYPYDEPREPHDDGDLSQWDADRLRAEVRRLRDVVWGETKLRAALAGARSARDEAIEERDWLKDELEAVRPQYEGHTRSLNGAIHELEAEQDRLRAVVEAALVFWYATYPTASAMERLVAAREEFEQVVRAAEISLDETQRRLDESEATGE